MRLELLEDRTLPAVTPNFAETLVRTSAPVNETAVPDVGAAANGDFVVVWQHKTADASPADSDIYYRRFNANGTPKDSTERVAENSGFNETAPRVAVNHVFGTGDVTFAFGSATDTPIVGDWNGDGKVEVGIYRNNTFFLDFNGNHLFDAADLFFSYGSAAGRPLAGIW
jgi:hypothetical protein